MTHTQGDWQAVRLTGAWAVMVPGQVIADVHNLGDENAANARLIAAAPSLLEALATIMAPNAWRHDTECKSIKEGMLACDCGYLKRIEQARAVIARCKGGAS